MRVYLVQHGDAVEADVDPQRPLSPIGRADVRRLAGFLTEAGIHVGNVVHSGKTRASQTAEVLAQALASGIAPEAVGGIGPNDPVATFAALLADWPQDVMVIGHQPFLGRLVGYMVCGDEQAALTDFQRGSIVCLTRDGDRSWRVAWMMRPDLLP